MSSTSPARTSPLTWQFFVLVALLLALLFFAAGFDRRSWPSMIGDESTYLMAAASLAWDFDLSYSAADFERFRQHWEALPEGLILQGGRGEGRLTFGKPFFYPLYLAPFVRLLPTRGPFLANALLLGLALDSSGSSGKPSLS